MVSACLLGENCKYNGKNNDSETVHRFIDGHEVIPVCPEVMGGLPVPRYPCEIVNGKVINDHGISCDHEYRTGAQKALQIALDNEVDLVILQSRSPSCGLNHIYDGTFSKKLIPGNGIFASMLLEHHIKVIDVKDLKEGIV